MSSHYVLGESTSTTFTKILTENTLCGTPGPSFTILVYDRDMRTYDYVRTYDSSERPYGTKKRPHRYFSVIRIRFACHNSAAKRIFNPEK
eukprot:g30890.t1